VCLCSNAHDPGRLVVVGVVLVGKSACHLFHQFDQKVYHYEDPQEEGALIHRFERAKNHKRLQGHCGSSDHRVSSLNDLYPMCAVSGTVVLEKVGLVDPP
jgi:hypothetical protein